MVCGYCLPVHSWSRVYISDRRCVMWKAEAAFGPAQIPSKGHTVPPATAASLLESTQPTSHRLLTQSPCFIYVFLLYHREHSSGFLVIISFVKTAGGRIGAGSVIISSFPLICVRLEVFFSLLGTLQRKRSKIYILYCTGKKNEIKVVLWQSRT